MMLSNFQLAMKPLLGSQTLMAQGLPALMQAAKHISASFGAVSVLESSRTSFQNTLSTRSYASKTASKEQQAAAAKNEPKSTEVGQGIKGHSGQQVSDAFNESYMLMHPTYPADYVEKIKPFHNKPESFSEWTGYYGVKLLRSTFDKITNYGEDTMNSKKWLTRFLFLETVAGVPGMVGAMLRHMRSLRTMKRDNAWIHTLLEEAENERMHLLTFMQMANPGMAFRASVIGTQGVFLSLYTVFYAISPRHCHAFVAYLEEEAVKTYSHCISDLDKGRLPEWENIQIPDIALSYWRLPTGSSMRDLLLAIRADELCHNHVNSVFAKLPADAPNPFAPGTYIAPL